MCSDITCDSTSNSSTRFQPCLPSDEGNHISVSEVPSDCSACTLMQLIRFATVSCARNHVRTVAVPVTIQGFDLSPDQRHRVGPQPMNPQLPRPHIQAGRQKKKARLVRYSPWAKPRNEIPAHRRREKHGAASPLIHLAQTKITEIGNSAGRPRCYNAYSASRRVRPRHTTV